MSSKGGTVLAFLALLVAMGALGYATWMNWQLQASLSMSAETQERNLKEMMISLAHTEGQLGKVKEAMNAFDLEKWLATVQGPLVDRLEQKMSAVQRTMLGDEAKKWVQEITRGQTEHWQGVQRSLGEARAEIEKDSAAAKALGGTLKERMRVDEKRSKKFHVDIQAQFTLLMQQNKKIQERLRHVDQPAERLLAQIETVRKDNEGFKKLLEHRGEADQEFQKSVAESLALFAGSAAQQKVAMQEQVDAAKKRWQGLFLTLRENHEAELESNLKLMVRLGEEHPRPPEKVTRMEPLREPEPEAGVSKVGEAADGRLGELLKFCARRPESVLCRDIEIR